MTTEAFCADCRRPVPAGALFCSACGSATPTTLEPVREPLPGEDRARAALQSAMGGGFKVGNLLGQGGFGMVFAARDLRLGRDVAVKMLRRELLFAEGVAERFRQEAQALALLNHPHIVPIFDIGETPELLYLVMPLLRGRSLAARLRTGGVLPLDVARRIIVGIAGALAAAHRAGLVHRDIKPENIMLEGADEHPLLMDFGIAKALRGQGTSLTSTGMILGTPLYMSPEQARGEDTVDTRADIYSLGALAFELFTGRVPFPGETGEVVLYHHLMTPPPDPRTLRPELPESTARALQRALSKRAEDRFQTVEEFAAALGGGDATVGGASQRRWSVGILARVTLLGTSLILGGWAWRAGSQPLTRVEVAGELIVEELRVRLAGAAPLWQRPLTLKTLSLAGLASVQLPARGIALPRQFDDPVLTLATLVTDSGAGQLSLDPIPLPDSTLVTLGPGGLPGGFALSIGDVVPRLALSADGPFLVQPGAAAAETLGFALARLRVEVAPGTLEIEAVPVEAVQGDLLGDVEVNGIGLDRIDRFRDEDQVSDRRESNIVNGILRLPGLGRPEQRLTTGEALSLPDFRGRIRGVRVDTLGIGFSFAGTVNGLPEAPGGMPTLRDQWWATRPGVLSAGVAGYLGWLLLVLFYRRGRA